MWVGGECGYSPTAVRHSLGSGGHHWSHNSSQMWNVWLSPDCLRNQKIDPPEYKGKRLYHILRKTCVFLFLFKYLPCIKLNIQVLNLYIHICRISFLFWGALMNNTNIENIDKWIVKVQKLSSVWWYPCQTKCCFKMACSYIYAD